MNLSKVVVALSILAIGGTASVEVYAEGYKHEFSLTIQSSDLGGGVSASGQALDYTYYPYTIENSDLPYAEEAFVAQPAYVSGSLTSSGGDVSGGSSEQWGFGIKGRFALPGLPYFAEAGYSQLALSYSPFMLSSAADINGTMKTLSLSAGMYPIKAAEFDLSAARSEANIDATPDVSATTITLHGKAVLPVTERYFTAIELFALRTTADVGTESAESTAYNAKLTWYQGRALFGTVGFGTNVDSSDPAAKYRILNLVAGWFFEPEVMVSLDYTRFTWENDSEDKYTSLRFTQKF